MHIEAQDHALTPIQSRLLKLAAEANGISASEVTGLSPGAVRTAAEALVQMERLVRCKVSPRRVRYFIDDAQVRAFQALAARPAAGRGPTLGPRMKAAWSADEPAIITPRTKITVAPPLPRNVYRTSTYPQF